MGVGVGVGVSRCGSVRVRVWLQVSVRVCGCGCHFHCNCNYNFNHDYNYIITIILRTFFISSIFNFSTFKILGGLWHHKTPILNNNCNCHYIFQIENYFTFLFSKVYKV